MSNLDINLQSLVNIKLDHDINEGNYESVHGALTIAARERMDSSFVIGKFIELANFYRSQKRLRESITLLSTALDLSPATLDIISNLSFSIALYLEQHSSELCDEDLRWTSTTVEMLYSINYGHAGGHHQLEHNRGIQKVNAALKSLKIQNDGKAESSHTHFLSSLSLKQYQNLTPEERKQKVSEIFARKLLELEREKGKTKPTSEGNSDA